MNPIASGDEVFVSRQSDGQVVEAFHRNQSGHFTEITGDVASVDVGSESFRVRGHQTSPGVDPWAVTVDRDVEATDTMLRGVVRAEAFIDVCRERVEANMDRYGLTKRERVVVWEMFSEESSIQIAERLCVDQHTVNNYISHMAAKIGLDSESRAPKRHAVIVALLGVEGLAADG